MSLPGVGGWGFVDSMGAVAAADIGRVPVPEALHVPTQAGVGRRSRAPRHGGEARDDAGRHPQRPPGVPQIQPVVATLSCWAEWIIDPSGWRFSMAMSSILGTVSECAA